MKSYLMAFRPKTLTAALVPCLVATFLAHALKLKFDWIYFYLALFSAMCIQIGTNLVNDATDFKKGADNENRIGPQRVTQSGIFTYKQVMLMAGFFFLLSVAAGIPLVVQGGWPIVGIGLASVLMGYGYTMGPYPLAYKGLGDLFVILFFGLIAVSGLFYVLTLEWRWEAFILGLQVGMHSTVLIAINNLRDHEGDRLVNKKTLAVRFGEAFSKWEISFLIFIPYFLNLYWVTKGLWMALVLSNFAAILGGILLIKIWKTKPSPAYNKFLGMASLHHILFGVLISLGFWLSIRG